MSQNIVSLSFTDAQLQAVDAALAELENQLSGLIALDKPSKRRLRKMGDKSEAFCRQALRIMAQNPGIVPQNVVNSGAIEDLEALDQLRPRLVRLSRLTDRGASTDLALGSDIMSASLQVYSSLKTSGSTEGLDPLRKELGVRFAKSPRQAQAKGA
jgi:hypothetical protein